MTRCAECGQTTCNKNACPGWDTSQSELQEALVGGPLMDVTPVVVDGNLPPGVVAVMVNGGSIPVMLIENEPRPRFEKAWTEISLKERSDLLRPLLEAGIMRLPEQSPHDFMMQFQQQPHSPNESK